MPRPLLFVACEKVIVAQDQTISIVSVLEKMISNVPAGAALPEFAAVRMRWSVLTVWLYEDSDEGKQFESIARLIAQDGSIAMHTEPSPIVGSPEKPRFRHIGAIDQFPVTDGNLMLTLLIREVGTDEWQAVSEYPIEVELNRS